jgi:rhamnosyltransferase
LLPFYEIDNVGITGPVYQISKVNEEQTYSEVKYLIQSCSVIRIDLFNIIGLFNEKLFIDSLDFDFCLRTLLADFKIIRCNNVIINHTIGSYKNILGIKITIHNSLRNYYIARNHRFLTIKYFSDFPLFIVKKNILFLIHIFKVVILENNREKIISLYKGICTKV